jgi:diguanylate cyclase (GGDEF)-like protein
MLLEQRLRQASVGHRIAATIALLLVPLAALSVASIVVLNEQETTFRESVEESIHTLLPLTTLEHYLQRALVDEWKAQSNESVPGFAALTENIDNSFASIENSAHDTDLPINIVTDAQQAWLDARPSVQDLIERVHTLHPGDNANQKHIRDDLQRAVDDIGAARQQLTRAVEARYTQAVAARRTQLLWLIWSWIITLTGAAVLIAALLHSLLSPLRELGRVAHRLGEGVMGVRSPVTGNDEFTVLARHFNDMADRWESTQQTLSAEAAEDPLTGALNRRGTLAALDTELAIHTAKQRPLSILMLDLDHFKRINDHFGHAAGDRALIWVTGAMRAMLREGDRLGRYGGDEFLIILPATDKPQAQQIARRMAQTIATGAASEATYPAISIGVACAPEDGQNADQLIRVADTALYQVKRERPTQPPAATQPIT